MNTTCETTIDLQNKTSLIVFVHQPAEVILFKIIWPCIIFAGIIFSILFIWSVIRISSLHTSTYIILTSLACADIGVLISLGMTHLPGVFTTPVRYAKFDTFEIPFFMLTWFCYTSSLGFVTLVSLERYLAICHPIRHHLLKGLKRTFKLICLVLLFASGLTLTTIHYLVSYSSACVLWPKDLVYSNYPRIIHLSSLHCQQNEIISIIIDILCSLTTILCALMNYFIYIRVLQELMTRKRSTTLPTSAELEKSIRQASIMVIVNGSVFGLLSIVVSITFSINALYSVLTVFEENHCVLFRDICFTCMLVNASINPLIYFTVNQRYRHAVVMSFRSLHWVTLLKAVGFIWAKWLKWFSY